MEGPPVQPRLPSSASGCPSIPFVPSLLCTPWPYLLYRSLPARRGSERGNEAPVVASMWMEAPQSPSQGLPHARSMREPPAGKYVLVRQSLSPAPVGGDCQAHLRTRACGCAGN